jgi:hypothetical protein
MAMFGRKPAAPLPDPTRSTYNVELSGTCCGGHKVSTTHQVKVLRGTMGKYTASAQCTCGADVDLTGWVGC